MNEYMGDFDYKEVNPGICFGVSFEKAEDGQYHYRMRYNTSLS